MNGNSGGAMAKTKKTKRPLNKKVVSGITIKYDVGFGNALYIRGSSGNLNWEQGHLLRNVGPDEWVWETNQPFKSCEFKVLINDSQYEQGNNHVLTCENCIEYTPAF